MKTSTLCVSTLVASAGLSVSAFAAQPTINWDVPAGSAYKWTEDSTWKTGSVTGGEFTWSGETGTPHRDPTGFILYFEGDGKTIGVVDSFGDTSDGGGIVVTGTGNTVTASLGRWAGSVQVDAGNILNAGWTSQLKDGTVIANGTVNFTSGNLNLDGEGARAWYVGAEGKITSVATGLSNGTIVVSGEINNVNASPESLDGLTNRTLGVGVKSKDLVSFTSGLSTGLGSLSVGEITAVSGELTSVDNKDSLTGTGQYYAETSSSGVKVYYTVDGVIQKKALTWTGTPDNNWTLGGTNWKDESGATTSFVNGDDVTFDSTASSKTVSLANGASVTTGTATISDNYTFVVGAGSATISGTTLTINSGSTLTLGNGDSKTVGLDYDKISLAGTLSFHNGKSSWNILEFSEAGATLHLHDTENNVVGLTISKVVVSNDAKITAEWGGEITLGTLSGAGNLSLVGSVREVFTVNINSFGDYSGNATLAANTINIGSFGTSSGTATFTKGIINVAGATTGKTASVVLENGVKMNIAASSTALNNITVKSGASLALSNAGVKLDYNTMTLDAGSTFSFSNGNGGEQIGSAGSSIVINAAGGTATIAGSYYGNKSNIQGKILGTGTVRFTSNAAIGGAGSNAYIVSAAISDKNSDGTLAVLVDSINVTFSGNNTYTGGTTITSNATLTAEHVSALGKGAVYIDSGSKLVASVSGVVISDGLTLKLGSAAPTTGSEFIRGSGSVTISEGAFVYIDISSLDLSEMEELALNIATAGALAVDKDNIKIGSWDSTLSTWTDSESWFVADYDSTTGILDITTTAIPEPSVFSLLAGLGALALMASRRRRKR